MRPWRGQVFETEAKVVAQAAYAAGQMRLRLRAPEIAAAAKPGQFVHLQASPCLPLRRPLSILDADPQRGTIEIYYKIVGQGTKALSQRKPGEALPIMGPIGRPFALDANRRYLLLGGGVGLPPVWFAAKRLAAMGAAAVLFAGNEAPLPFATRPSTFLLPGVPEDAWLTFEALEEIGIPARIASRAEIPGAFFGFVTELAERWLAAIADDFRENTEILACGPEPMLAAAQKLARAFALPAQLALEARMACAIGGCAGCVVRTRENGRAFYRRVCVDGPVFPAEIVAEWD